MRSVFSWWMCALFIVFFASCGEGDEPVGPVAPDKPAEPARRTVLLYFAADNNLAPYAKTDLEEAKAGLLASSVEGIHLLVYCDFGGDARLIELVKEGDAVSEKVIREYGERNSVGVDETREVFSDAFTHPDYEAESYALVYWSHGDGWIPYPVPSTRWIGQDKGEGDKRMNLSDFISTLEGMPHLDFIYFDACFMQSIEVAYALRDYADYYLASPTETPGTGAPYERILSAMLTEGAVLDIADIYYRTYNTYYTGEIVQGNPCNTTETWNLGASICVLSTAELESLASLTAQLLPEDALEVADLRSLSFNYDKRSKNSSVYVGYYDWDDMMQALLDEADYATWKQAFDASVAYWATTPMNYSSSAGMFSMEGTSGISHYIPQSLTSDAAAAYRDTEWYEAAGLAKLGW